MFGARAAALSGIRATASRSARTSEESEKVSRARGRAQSGAAEPAPDCDVPLEGRQLPHLGEPDVVARRVVECRVDSVRALFRLLDEIDTPVFQLLIGGLAVVGRKEDRAGE